MFPQRRLDRITVRTLPDETLLYDGERNKVHCLNQTSTLIWKHCDGQTSPETLAQIVEQRLHLADATAVVRLALEQLYRRGLLDAAPAAKPLTDEARMSRRVALKKFAIAAAVALPIVMTLTPRANANLVRPSNPGCPGGTIQCGPAVDHVVMCCDSTEECRGDTCVKRPAPAPTPVAKAPSPSPSPCGATMASCTGTGRSTCGIGLTCIGGCCVA